MSKRPRKLLDQASEVIRRKHYSIREERDGNPYTQYDAQPEGQKREALSTSRFALRPRFSEAQIGPDEIRDVKRPNDLSSVTAGVCRKASDQPKPVATQKH